jgi:hypothetical protein
MRSGILTALVGVLSMVAVAAELPEPPPVPFDTGGEIQLGGQKLKVLPPGRLPEFEALLPKVAPAQNPVPFYFAAINGWASKGLIKDGQDALRPGQPGWNEAQPEFTEWLKQNELALKYIDKAAQFPTARWPIMFNGDDKPDDPQLMFAAALPQLSHMRLFARCRAIIARRAAAKGDFDEAVREIGLAFALSRHTDGCGPLIQVLVSAANDAITLEAAEDVLCAPKITRAQVVKLSEALDARAKSLTRGVEAMKFEEQCSLQAQDLILSGHLGLGALTRMGGGLGGAPTVSKEEEDTWQSIVQSRASRIIFPDRTMRRHFTDGYAELRKDLADPYWKSHAAADDFERRVEQIPRWSALARMILPMHSRIGSIVADRRENFDVAHAAVAVKLYTLDKGAPPKTLAELVPKYLPALPMDEMVNKPLLYKTDGGVRVYSVGRDLKDNGGERGNVGGDGTDQVFYIEDVPARTADRKR